MPGVDPAALASFFEQQAGNILSMFNMFSGGALERFGIFALGIMPYISASIIMQMATVIVPSLASSSRRKASRAGARSSSTRATARCCPGGFQSLAPRSWPAESAGRGREPGSGNFRVHLRAVTLVTGTMFLMWLGEQITERGIGNGISMIILAGIVAGLPVGYRRHGWNWFATGEMSPALALMLIGWASRHDVFVVYMERAQRRITVNYAKRQQGRRMYAGAEHAPAVQDQHVGRHPADLRVERS